MPLPARWDWHIWIGNDLQADFCLEGIDLTGTVVVVTFTWAGGKVILRSDGPSPAVTFLPQPFDGVLGWLRVRQTASQTRTLPVGVAITYEIEHWASTGQTTYLTGRAITATGGNVDV